MRPDPKQSREAVDESAESEIAIHPDGRVFVFGVTAPLAEILGGFPSRDERTTRLLRRISALAAGTGRRGRIEEDGRTEA